MKKLYDGAPPTKLLPKPKAFMGHPLHLGCAIGSRASFLLKAMPSGGGVANHLDEARRAELQHDLEAFHDGFATDLGIALPHEYLLTISTRRRQSHDSARSSAKSQAAFPICESQGTYLFRRCYQHCRSAQY